MVNISEKQKMVLSEPMHRINLLEGSVRSGKTWISLVMWALFVASMPRDAEFLMVGKTLMTLRRNCLGLLQELEPTFSFNSYNKKATLYGHTIWLEGADNERSENKIRGMTLAGAYMDELTLIPQNFYYMTLSRLSYRGAKFFATTNPDSPNHYVYTDIIQNDAIDKKVTKFYISENPFLDPEYVRQLASEYVGVFYQRFFLGEWVIAEGLVYPMYANTVPTEPRIYTEYCVSMDYGIMNPTAMILWGRCGDTWYAIKEYYHSGRGQNEQKTDQDYYEELKKLCEGVYIDCVIVDPSASSFIALIRQKHEFRARPADNAVMDGIRHTASCLQEGVLKFNDCCKDTIKEFGLYSWDPKSTEDRVIKENDHAMDAIRYFVETKRIWKKRRELDEATFYGGGIRW
jgi:PBSX family phage terminase large subunit